MYNDNNDDNNNNNDIYDLVIITVIIIIIIILKVIDNETIIQEGFVDDMEDPPVERLPGDKWMIQVKTEFCQKSFLFCSL